MNHPVTQRSLRQQNQAFSGTNGVSQNNRSLRFLPAFRDEETGQVELARFEDCARAPHRRAPSPMGGGVRQRRRHSGAEAEHHRGVRPR